MAGKRSADMGCCDAVMLYSVLGLVLGLMQGL
jgi:hypothetical protein